MLVIYREIDEKYREAFTRAGWKASLLIVRGNNSRRWVMKKNVTFEVVKRCSCGKAYTDVELWTQPKFVGIMRDEEETLLLFNCIDCGSTLAISV